MAAATLSAPCRVGRRPGPALRASASLRSPLQSTSFSRAPRWAGPPPVSRQPPLLRTAQTAAPLELETAQAAEGGEKYDWERHWFAVLVAADVPGDRPTPLTLLGKQLVVWKDAAGRWCCVEDRCPHRAAPLSEGKVWEDGTLMCSYHGWRFEGGGACVAIPQAASAEAEAAACAGPRSCAVAHPIQEAQGLLFVFGLGGPAGRDASLLEPLPLDPYLQGAAPGTPINSIMRLFMADLPYDFSTLVENAIDPAHVPFSHHQVQGNRDKVTYGQSSMSRVPDEDGISFSMPGSMFGVQRKLTFRPPQIVHYHGTTNEGEWLSFIIWVVPTTPGRSRIIVRVQNTLKKMPRVVKLLERLPLWLEHFKRWEVLDGDSIFLSRQEHLLVDSARAQGKSVSTWRQVYHMPTAADGLVAAFRAWLDGPGGGGPFGPLHLRADYPPVVTDRRQLLNRFEHHTKHCKSCSKAFATISTLLSVAAAAAAVAWGAALLSLAGLWRAGAAAAPAAAGPMQMAALFAAALLVTGGVALLQQLRQKFLFVDFSHAYR